MGRSGWFRGFAVALMVVGTPAALSAQQTAAPDSVPAQPVVTAGGGLPGLPERISGDRWSNHGRGKHGEPGAQQRGP